MKRKLIKQAGQAVTITIPIDWIRNNGLNAGDEIDLIQNENDLILRSNKKVLTGKFILDISSFSRRAKYIHINSAYARGFDELLLDLGKDSIPKFSQNMGYAVIEQKGTKIVVKDISGISTENLDDIFKRVFQMIMNFYDSAIIDIFGNSEYTLERVYDKDREINTFILFLQRSIMKMSYPDPVIGRVVFAYSYALEQIGDEISRAWRTNVQGTIKRKKELKDFVLISRDMLGKAFEIYFQSSSERIKEILKLKDNLRKTMSGFDKLDSDTIEFLLRILKIGEDSADLTQLSLMKKMK